MKNSIYKSKALVEVLKSPELHVIDATAVIKSTITFWKLISSNSNDLDNTTKAALVFIPIVNVEDFFHHYCR